MVPALRAMAHARSVIQPQATPFRLFLRYFQPLATPDALHTLVIDVPALMTKQRGDAPIAVTAILAGKIDNGLRQGIFVIAHDQRAALRRSRLSQRPASSPLRDSQLLLNMANRLPASCGAEYSPFSAYSRIALSNACSATSFLRRAFSRSRSLSFLPLDTCMPPYAMRQR